jgi:hypothetical protein
VRQLNPSLCCFHFSFSANGQEIVAFSRSPEHLLEICNVVLRLVAASDVHFVYLDNRKSPEFLLMDALALAYLLEQCQSLKYLKLIQLTLDENHCRALSGSRDRTDIELIGCKLKLTSAETFALVKVLARNQGPTKLNLCRMDNSVLANGLRGKQSSEELQTKHFLLLVP